MRRLAVYEFEPPYTTTSVFLSCLRILDTENDRLVGMWESRGLCEISKSLWKPFLGFHRDAISTAVLVRGPCETGNPGVLDPGRLADRRS